MGLLMVAVVGCAGGHTRPSVSTLPSEAEQHVTLAQERVIKTAHSLLGTPYRYGGTTPEGFDCSGFLFYVYRTAVGIELPRSTHDLIQVGQPVSVTDLRPADLVYFKIERQKPLHAGIYIGEGKFIHAPSTSGKVNIQNLTQDYGQQRYLGARRVL